MTRIFGASLLVVAIWAIGSAQGAPPAPPPVPEYAGQWELNVAESKLPTLQVRSAPGVTGSPRLPPPSGSITGQTMTVTQNTKQLSVATVTRTEGQMEVPPQALTYNLDGTDLSFDQKMGRMTAPAIAQATVLDDGRLSLVTKATVDGPRGVMTITTTSVWKLDLDGKTLRVHRTRESPRGTEETDWIYHLR